MTRVITFGTYDLFHYGHLRILERAKQLGNHLIVGISTDKLNYQKKNNYPTYNEQHRLEIVQAIRYVDQTFYEQSLELKAEYIKKYQADILVMGDDWEGEFDYLKPLCKVQYFSRTENISSSSIHQYIRNS